MNKKLFGFSTKTLVGTALGAALFTVLFMYVKIPTGIPETQIQSAYGIGGFFAAMFGPIAGFLIAFIGHALSDIVQYGSAWWSWVIASGVSCLIIGLVYPKLKVEEGIFGVKDGRLSSQVQHFLEIKSKGERKSRHLRGRELIRCTTRNSSFSETKEKSAPLGKKKRRISFVFSFDPRCHGE